ncbi:MAG TPA: SRPBCC domain-containing protein, partial [Actinomycetota bacterium]|nr:SRPBCC domain-containing protein [Actinomycetota bacterium]
MAAKTKNELKVSLPDDTTILLEREFDAPRRLVWEAMTKPEYMSQWWGPRGTTLPVCEIDLRVGGEWRFLIRNPDGSEHPFRGEYREIEPVELLSYTWTYDVAPFNEQIAIETVRFEERDGRTYARTTMEWPTKEARDGHANAMQDGAAQTMDR